MKTILWLGNHRGSIFRLIVGTALISRDKDECPTRGEGNSADNGVGVELELERAVSAHIVFAAGPLARPGRYWPGLRQQWEQPPAGEESCGNGQSEGEGCYPAVGQPRALWVLNIFLIADVIV